MQVDLSDDYLMLMMFADPAWQETLIPIQLTDRSGAVSQLEMSEQEFKDFVGLIKSLQVGKHSTKQSREVRLQQQVFVRDKGKAGEAGGAITAAGLVGVCVCGRKKATHM